MCKQAKVIPLLLHSNCIGAISNIHVTEVICETRKFNTLTDTVILNMNIA